jgi:hypothetical protein
VLVGWVLYLSYVLSAPQGMDEDFVEEFRLAIGVMNGNEFWLDIYIL